jgi:hypothetical protein
MSNLKNDTSFIERNMYDHFLDLKSITGQRILLLRIYFTPFTLPFSFTRRQSPMRTAFAMTINKA